MDGDELLEVAPEPVGVGPGDGGDALLEVAPEPVGVGPEDRGDALLEVAPEPVGVGPGDDRDASEAQFAGSFQPNIEQEDLEKASLVEENFTLRNQVKDLTDSFVTKSAEVETLKVQYNDTVSQLEDRLVKYRNLENERDTLSQEKYVAEDKYLAMKREKDDRDISLRKVAREKQMLASQNLSLKHQLEELVREKEDVEATKRILEQDRISIQIELEQSRNEKLLFAESKRWFLNEIAERDGKLAQARVENSAREAAMHNERQRLVNEKELAEGKAREWEATQAKHKELLDQLNRKMISVAETHDEEKRAIEAELRNKDALIQLYRDNEEKLNASAQEARSEYEQIYRLLEEAKQGIAETKEHTEEQMRIANQQLAERDAEIDRLMEDLKKANELLENRYSSNLSDDAIAALSPSAAAASRLIKGGCSLTAIYREHTKVLTEYEEEKRKVAILEQEMHDLISEFEERAPMLLHQKEELERALDDREKLTEQLRKADELRIHLADSRDSATRELAFTKCELEKYQRDTTNLSNQVAHLMFVLERGERRDCGDSPSQAEDEDKQLFNNIRQLQRRNMQLESDLASQKEKLETAVRTAQSAELDQLRNELQSVVDKLASSELVVDRLQVSLNKSETSIESYRRIIEQGGMDADAAATRRIAERVARELEEEKTKTARLNEMLMTNKREREELMRTYEERIEQQYAVIAEVKMNNARLESDNEMHKQSAVAHRSEWERTAKLVDQLKEHEQKNKQQAVATENRLAQTTQALVAAQNELQTLKVELRSTSDELALSRQKDQRLSNEIEVIRHSSYQSQQMLSSLREVESRLNRVEMEKKSLLEEKVEMLTHERDDLKNRNAALYERVQALEEDNRNDTKKMRDEREEMSRLMKQKAEEAAAADARAAELRLKLIEAQNSLTSVDGTVGVSSERLHKECQQLKHRTSYLEKELEETKRRLTISEKELIKRTEEVNRMTVLSGTLENTLNETANSGGMLEQQLTQQLANATRYGEERDGEVNKLRTRINELEEERNAFQSEEELQRRQLSLKCSQAEVQLKDLEMRFQMKDEAYEKEHQLVQELSERITQIEQKAEQDALFREDAEAEKEDHEAKMLNKEIEMTALEDRLKLAVLEKQESDMTHERRISAMREELAEKTTAIDELNKKHEELFEQIGKLTNELTVHECKSGGSIDPNSSMETMNGVIRCLREEKQRAIERMMRAEIEMKRLRAQNDEIERESNRLNENMRELQKKEEAYSLLDIEMATLRTKAEQLHEKEREVVQLRIAKERLEKVAQEAQHMRQLLDDQLARQADELTKERSEAATSRVEVESKTREMTALRKNLEEKSIIIQQMRLELDASRQSVEARGTMAEAERMKQLKDKETQIAQLTEQVAVLKKTASEQDVKFSQLKQLALKYKNAAKNTPEASPAKSDIPGQITRLQEEVNSLTEQIETLRATNEELTLAKQALEEANTQLTAQNEELNYRVTSLTSLYSKNSGRMSEMQKEINALRGEAKTEVAEPSSAPMDTSSISAPATSTASPSLQTTSVFPAKPLLAPPVVLAPSTVPTVPVSAPSSSLAPSLASSLATLTSAASEQPPPVVASAVTALPLAALVPEGSHASSSETASSSHPSMFGGFPRSGPSFIRQPSSTPSSTTSSLLSHGPLFGRSLLKGTTDSEENSGSSQGITSSSGIENRKRPANDSEHVETKRQREDDDVISSSERNPNEEEVEEVPADEVQVAEDDADVDDLSEGEEDEQIANDEDIDDEDEEGDGGDDDVQVVVSDSDSAMDEEGEDEDEEEEEMGGDADEDSDREAASALEEADDEGRSLPPEDKPTQSAQEQPEKKKRIPITFRGEEEQCSSSNESRPSQKRPPRGGGSGPAGRIFGMATRGTLGSLPRRGAKK